VPGYICSAVYCDCQGEIGAFTSEENKWTFDCRGRKEGKKKRRKEGRKKRMKGRKKGKDEE